MMTETVAPPSCSVTTTPVEYCELSPAEQEQILVLQQDILEAVALGHDHMKTINQVCALEEKLLPNSVASVMLLDETGHHLDVYAAPTIPKEGIAQLNGLRPGPHAGSCGNVIYRQEPVFVSDTLTDPRWDDIRPLALNFGLMACWSMPIRTQGGKVVGTFALSSFEHRSPSPFHRKLLEIGASIIGIVLERRKEQDALRELNATLEKRVQEEVAKNREKDHLLIQQSRLASMGEMVRNIAHQWRQPLNALGLVIVNVKDAFEFGELTENTLNTAVETSNRILGQLSSTIDDFRDFFRPDKDMAFFDIGDAIRDATTLITAALEDEHIQLRLDLADGLQIQGFKAQFSQAVLNILANAKEAIHAAHPEGGHIAVKLIQQDNQALITIEDDGGGIPANILPKIFDPYFTTKDHGSGIGLYMAKAIIEHNHNGTIGAANSTEGACITLTFPLS